jgi:hypothetical protein
MHTLFIFSRSGRSQCHGGGQSGAIGTAAAFCVDAAATLLWLCMRALITLAAASVINLPAGRSMRTQ